MKTDFSMGLVMGGLLGGDYTAPLCPSDISPEYDDENLDCGFGGQLVGFGGGQLPIR